MKQSD